MKIRFAAPDDAAALLRIYAQYIETTITFEYTLPTEQTFSERIASISSVYPYLVCEEGGRAVGYAYAHRQMEREAYQWNAELSIYLDPSVTSKGLGRKLYGVLMEVLKLQNIKTVYGVVTQPNLKSEKLHLSMGFTRAGFFRNTGFKCGAWRDVVWFEKQIAPYEPQPEPIRPIRELPRETLEAILQPHCEGRFSI